MTLGEKLTLQEFHPDSASDTYAFPKLPIVSNDLYQGLVLKAATPSSFSLRRIIGYSFLLAIALSGLCNEEKRDGRIAPKGG